MICELIRYLNGAINLKEIMPLNLGIVGSSLGNGHPFSWSAILNGYNKSLMEQCPYPSIPAYLAKETIEAGSLGAVVSHIWTEDYDQSIEIAACSNIPNVCRDLDELISSVDGVLHARDDYQKHPRFLKKYIGANLPCFIDKPFCLDTKTARNLFSFDPHQTLIFTCSALLFSREFESISIERIGNIIATGPKDWDKYAIHLIEPSIRMLGNPLLIDSVRQPSTNPATSMKFFFENEKSLEVLCSGVPDTPFSFVIDGTTITVNDYYSLFKTSLEKYIEFMNTRINSIDRSHTMQVISLLESGTK
jgi:hypothetical protein